MKKRARAAKIPRPPLKSVRPRPSARPKKAGEGHWISDSEYARLRDQLREAQETLEAIQLGTVDAVVVKGDGGSQIYSLVGTELRYRIYVEQMQEGAITLSQDGLILYCNQRFADMVMQPLERVISGKISDYFTPESWVKLSTVMTQPNEIVKCESVLLRADGTILEIHFSASRMPACDENITCVVVTDLTEQKSQQGLQLAKDVADRSNLAKDSFLAALSHELRTPLTPALLASVALEQNPDLSEDVRRELAMIRRNIELEARLIDDLLDLTRIAQGKLELHRGRIDLHVIVRSAFEICRTELEAKRHHVDLRLEATHTVTMADAVRIQQALWNLLRNAVKFTPVGGKIVIRTGNTGSAMFWVEVRDTGIGFQEHQLPKMFGAFQQGGRHITREFGGLGLGLAISSSIVEAHGGSISAKSEGTNLGATFTVQLPLLAVGSSAPERTVSTPPMPGKVRRLQILLVEDHHDTRLTVQRYLQGAQFDVTAAESAAQALQFAANQSFDLVVSDLGLPDNNDGLTMMRSLHERHGLYGIAVSGYGMEEDVRQSLAAGFSHHLTKPINLARLQQLIVEVANQPILRKPRVKLRADEAQDTTTNRTFPAQVDNQSKNGDLLDGSAARVAPPSSASPEGHSLQRENASLRGDLRTICRRMSHDLRTPLNCIGAATAALSDLAEQTEATVIFIQSILDSVSEAGVLIERLTFVLNASATPLPPKEPLRMAEIVARAVHRLQLRITKAGAKMTLPATWPSVAGRSSWIELVWGNLIRNSLDHGGARPRLELGWETTSGGFRFWLRDSGDGVPSKQQPRLFHPLERLDEDNAPRGYGLPIVRRLVELHGGRCGHDDHPGSGGTFYFMLPGM
jgi:PAS domain S-box-containing protein